MDPRLLQYYGRELNYVREMGAEFAREFPKVAGRLGLDTFECADPYVERLLEGFAFMAARIHLKLDDEFPRFTQHLLEIVYPHYLAPTPSMAVVQMRPNLAEGTLAQGYRVPRGTALRSLLGRGEQTPCEYRTSQDVTLWPLELTFAEYTGYVGDIGDVKLPARARGAIRFKLRTTAGLNFADLALDDLPLFIRGADELPMKIYEQIMAHAVAIVARRPTVAVCPARTARRAPPRTGALARRTSEFRPVKPSGSRGRSGGGQCFADKRNTRYMPINPANSMHSLAMMTVMARRALLIGGTRSMSTGRGMVAVPALMATAGACRRPSQPAGRGGR